MRTSVVDITLIS